MPYLQQNNNWLWKLLNKDNSFFSNEILPKVNISYNIRRISPRSVYVKSQRLTKFSKRQKKTRNILRQQNYLNKCIDDCCVMFLYKNLLAMNGHYGTLSCVKPWKKNLIFFNVLMANCIIWLSNVSVIHSTKCSLWLNFRLEIYKQMCTTVLRPPFFLIYINDLPEGLKLLADDNSSFSIVKCVNTTAVTLNNFWKKKTRLNISMSNVVQSQSN